MGVLDLPDTVNVDANVGVWDIASTFGFDDIAFIIIIASNTKETTMNNAIIIIS